MFNLGRWFASWACFGMLLYPVTPLLVASAAVASEPSPGAVAKAERTAAPLDVSYVPATATFAIVIRPQPLLTGSNADWMPVEVMTAVGMQQYGVDPMQIREVVAFLVPPPAATPNVDPSFGIVVRFIKPYDKAALLAKLPAAERIEERGIEFYQLSGPTKRCVHLPDERTIMFALRPTLAEMLAAKGVDSPLIRLLKSTDFSGTYTAVVSFDAMRDLITKAMESMPQLPPPLVQFRKLPELVSSAKIGFDVADGIDFSVALHAVDDQAAKELLDLANNAMTTGRQILLGQMQQRMHDDSNDPVQEATHKYTARIINQTFDRVKSVREGRDVKIAVHAEVGTAVVGVLVALLLPAAQSAREAARRAQAANNLRQIGLAMLSFENDTGRYPARAIFDKNGKPLLSWRVQLLPYLDAETLYKQFRLDEPWDSEHNKPLIARMPTVFISPTQQPDPAGKTNYLVPVGPGTVFEGTKGLKINQITNGTSNTILAVEADNDHAVIWTKPDDLPVTKEKPRAGLGGLRVGGFQALFGDGSVRFISNTIDPQILVTLFTYAGGKK